MQKLRKLKAFTLVELLVVLAIIAILATIIVVNYSGVQGRARQTSTISSLNNLATAASVCLTGSTLVDPAEDTALCADETLTNAKWPASLTMNNYTIVLPTVAGGVVTVAPTATNAALPTITCSLSSGSYHCQ